MDKIREKFEKYRNNDPYGRIKKEEKLACFVDFQAGYKSRDKEIKKLRDALEEIKKRKLYVIDNFTSADAYIMNQIAQEALEE